MDSLPRLHVWTADKDKLLGILYLYTNLRWADIVRLLDQAFAPESFSASSAQMHWHYISSAPHRNEAISRLMSMDVSDEQIGRVLAPFRLRAEARRVVERHSWTDVEYKGLVQFRLWAALSAPASERIYRSFSMESCLVISEATIAKLSRRCLAPEWAKIRDALLQRFGMDVSTANIKARWRHLVRDRAELVKEVLEHAIMHPFEVNCLWFRYGLRAEPPPECPDEESESEGEAEGAVAITDESRARKAYWRYTAGQDAFVTWYRIRTTIKWQQLVLIFNHYFHASVAEKNFGNGMVKRFGKLKAQAGGIEHMDVSGFDEMEWASLGFFNGFWRQHFGLGQDGAAAKEDDEDMSGGGKRGSSSDARENGVAKLRQGRGSGREQFGGYRVLSGATELRLPPYEMRAGYGGEGQGGSRRTSDHDEDSNGETKQEDYDDDDGHEDGEDECEDEDEDDDEESKMDMEKDEVKLEQGGLKTGRMASRPRQNKPRIGHLLKAI